MGASAAVPGSSDGPTRTWRWKRASRLTKTGACAATALVVDIDLTGSNRHRHDLRILLGKSRSGHPMAVQPSVLRLSAAFFVYRARASTCVRNSRRRRGHPLAASTIADAICCMKGQIPAEVGLDGRRRLADLCPSNPDGGLSNETVIAIRDRCPQHAVGIRSRRQHSSDRTRYRRPGRLSPAVSIQPTAIAPFGVARLSWEVELRLPSA